MEGGRRRLGVPAPFETLVEAIRWQAGCQCLAEKCREQRL